MTRKAVIASDGSVWPITGYWCRGCMLPMHPTVAAEGYETHPSCGPDEVPDRFRIEEVETRRYGRATRLSAEEER